MEQRERTNESDPHNHRHNPHNHLLHQLGTTLSRRTNQNKRIQKKLINTANNLVKDLSEEDKLKLAEIVAKAVADEVRNTTSSETAGQ